MNELEKLILLSDDPVKFGFASGLHIFRFRNGKWDISGSIRDKTLSRDFDYVNFAIENGIAVGYRGYSHTHVLSSGDRRFYFKGSHDDAILYCLKHNLIMENELL